MGFGGRAPPPPPPVEDPMMSACKSCGIFKIKGSKTSPRTDSKSKMF